MAKDATGREIKVGDRVRYHPIAAKNHNKSWGSCFLTTHIVTVVEVMTTDLHVLTTKIAPAHQPIHVAAMMEVVDE